VKFVSIDFFDPKTNPPPSLPFEPGDAYIPAATSMMKNLEDSIAKAADKLPELTDAIVAIMGRIDRMVAELERDGVTHKVASAMAHADEVLTSLDRTLVKLDRAQLPEKAAGTLDELHVAITKLNKVLDRIDGQTGLVASAQRAADAFGEGSKTANSSAKEIEATMKDIREAAEAIRSLVETLERDPDMLLKGRAKGKSQ
jgi:uncharacterized protein YukE